MGNSSCWQVLLSYHPSIICQSILQSNLLVSYCRLSVTPVLFSFCIYIDPVWVVVCLRLYCLTVAKILDALLTARLDDLK